MQLTHEEGGPWYVTRDEHSGELNAEIPNTLIQAHFEKKIQENAAAKR